MTWRVILEHEAGIELQNETETYGEDLLDEFNAVREWLGAMPLRYPAWQVDPAYRRAVISRVPFRVFFRIDEARRTVVIGALAPTSREPRYWHER